MHRFASASTRSSLVLSIFITPKSISSIFLKAITSKPKSITPFLAKPLCTVNAIPATAEVPELYEGKRSILLEKLRLRHLKEDPPKTKRKPTPSQLSGIENDNLDTKAKPGKKPTATCFEELGLTEEVIEAVNELKIEVPTEIQCIGIPAILERKSVVLGSHTGSGKTLAYLLPLVQLLRQDEASSGVLMKPKRPRAVVLCPTRELCEQVYRVAKSISHHARFRSIMLSGGGRLRPQEDSLSSPIDMIVGTPGRILQHIEEGNMAYGEIKYLVLDEADTMFDRGFGPDIRKFLKPLKNRSLKDGAHGFQTVLVSATMTKAVQQLIDEEFEEIVYLRTSSLHKKVSSCSHNFIKLSGSENKLEALLQVLEPSLAKGNKVMVFCNTLNSSRAVDHFLAENQISTVNYHGEVPAEKRVENLEKFRSDDGDCPTLVCTDLAARGLDINVDHVIIFDFPSNSVDYVHRTGRTARMGAKGKVTSLVTKKDLLLANRIEEAIQKNESLESFSVGGLHRDLVRTKVTDESAVKPFKKGRVAVAKRVVESDVAKGKMGGNSKAESANRTKTSPVKKSMKVVKIVKKVGGKGAKVGFAAKGSKPLGNKSDANKSFVGKRRTTDNSADKSPVQKLRVVAFRGKSSLS